MNSYLQAYRGHFIQITTFIWEKCEILVQALQCPLQVIFLKSIFLVLYPFIKKSELSELTVYAKNLRTNKKDL